MNQIQIGKLNDTGKCEVHRCNEGAVVYLSGLPPVGLKTKMKRIAFCPAHADEYERLGYQAVPDDKVRMKHPNHYIGESFGNE